MVMGPTHAMSGAGAWLAGVTFSSAIMTSMGVTDPTVYFLGAMIAGGAALAPDIDSHSSTVVNSFGIMGKVFHRIANSMSLTVYHATRTRKDGDRNNGHRTLFHTPIMAIFISLIVALSTSLKHTVTIFDKVFSLGQLSALFVLFIFLHLAMAGIFEKKIKSARRKYGPYVMLAFSAVVTVIIASLMPSGETYAWLGFAVGFGWFMHLLGDMITKMGVPLLFPIKFRGKRWWDVTLPTALRIKAGGDFEKYFLMPYLTLATTLLAIYAIPWVTESFSNPFSLLGVDFTIKQIYLVLTVTFVVITAIRGVQGWGKSAVNKMFN